LKVAANQRKVAAVSDRLTRKQAKRWVVQRMTELLTQPLHTYEQRIPNSFASLKQNLKPGDVILVEGDQRVSQVIRYLTQSSWSHSALFIGDELRRFRPDLADTLRERHGELAQYLLLEADVGSGVACSPVSKYLAHNVRVCRPRGLRREDLDHMLAELTAQLGKQYNVRQILELGRYFMPVSLIPRRFRRTALQLGGDTTTNVICTTMIARAFSNVGFPIVPRVSVEEIQNPLTWLSRLRRRNGHSVRALYQRERPELITPRDFDLSPYFEIVKCNFPVVEKFDYRQIEWATDDKVRSAALPTPAIGSGSGNGRVATG